MFPDINTIKLQAQNRMLGFKQKINRLKNLIAPETEDMAELITYKNNLPAGAWKDVVTQAIDAIQAIYDEIISEGF